MAIENKEASPKLTRKITISFLLIMVLVGVTYILTTTYFTNKYFEETTQLLNSEIANHIIEEKFKEFPPFTDSNEVNKALFGDLMHDMMAVNRGIEVYLLDDNGEVLYSVVLDHEKANAPVVKVDVKPIHLFIEAQGKGRILGDDPRVPGQQKIFSAAAYQNNDKTGYIYIILASKAYDDVTNGLFSSYFMRLGFGASILTILFAVVIGFLSIRYLTKNLRDIIFAVRRFKEGDMSSRISNNSSTDLSVLANTFNEMADTIVENIDTIKSVENLRRELTANISHDLRSPIAIAQGYVETMQMKNIDLSEQDRTKYLEIVHNSMKRLTVLVDQLFEYSKLEANQIKAEKEPFIITELASDVIANYKVLADKRNIDLNLISAKNIPLVFADISLVERVFQNLMDNALQFTPKEGSISLEIKVDEKNVILMVKDSGPGIPKNEQLHIFERYVQMENKSGAGLGLAIVKKIIDLHESTIKVMSKPNEGASFQFTLQIYTEMA